MVTITPITDAAGAKSYFQKDDYYTRDATGGRAWMGKTSESLGLTEVSPDAFQAVLEGKDLNGNTLVAAASNGVHRAGWDITFSPSKSVSLAWAFGNEQQRGTIMAAHNAAVASTMRYVEDNLIQARVTVAGKTAKINTGSMVAARFDHYTTRELDPELHTHVVVADVTRCPDGKYRAVANEKVFARELDTALYENELAFELRERGFSVTMRKYDTGNSRYACIDDIPEEVSTHFSKRSDQIMKAMEPLKEHYPNASREELRQIACLGTRQAKQTVDSKVLHDAWETQLQGLGYDRGSLASVHNALSNRIDGKPGEHDIVQQACGVLNEQESTFSREDVMKTAARLSGGSYRIEDLERAFVDLKGTAIVTLDKAAGVYTTKQMKALEKGIVTLVREGQGTVAPVLADTGVEEVTGQLYGHLTPDQKRAMAHILTSTDRVIGIQGDAGTGKTTMLRAAREQLEGQGYTVRGLSFTGKAAKELALGAGVQSQTLHSFLPTIGSPDFTLSAKEAWFVDEVSMVGSRQMSELIGASKRCNASVVLIGDTKQLQSIDAGKMFQKLQETGAMKTVHLKETVRQTNEDYRALVGDIAEKKIDSAFSRMTVQKKIHEITDDTERHDAIVKRVLSHRDYRKTLVVTPLNTDRRAINKHIRDNLKDKGTLKGEEHAFTVREPKTMGPTEMHFADSYAPGDYITTNGRIKGVKIGTKGRVMVIDRQLQTVTLLTDDRHEVAINVGKDGDKIKAFREQSVPFMKGDRIVFLNNDRPLGVQNGLTAEIKGIDPTGYITATKDNGDDVRWNIRHSYNYLDHGYAVTDYKSQGQTSREVIFHTNTDRPTSYNSFYVAATRGKDNVHVYTNNTGKLKDQVKKEVRKTSSLDYDRTPGQRYQRCPSMTKHYPQGGTEDDRKKDTWHEQ